MKGLIVAAVLLVSCAPVPPAAVATPSSSAPPTVTATASASVAPTATATPLPTATVAAGLTRYVSTELGYSVDLPTGWRRATCSPGIVTTSPMESSEWFIGVPEAEEIITVGVRLLQMRVIESGGLTPQAWLERNASQPDARFEPATVNDRPGVRAFIGVAGHTYGYGFAARGWIYAFEMTYFGSQDQELERVLTTVRILDDATVGRGPTTTPVPRSIESLVDSLTDGFAKRDIGAIAGTLAPCITVGAVPGETDRRTRTAYVTTLAVDFAAGTSVQVQARPIESDPNYGRFVRSTWSRSGAPDQRVDLLLRAEANRWSVVGVLIRL